MLIATRLRPDPTHREGVALGLGVLIFLLSRARHLVSFPEPALWVVLPTAFVLWTYGLAGFRARYAPRSSTIGRRGLRLTVVGVWLLTIGHLGLLVSLLGPATLPQVVRDVAGGGFVPVILGTLALSTGMLLFGLDVLRGGILRRLRGLPVTTGLVGIAWMLFANDSRPVEGNLEAFIAMRTLFGIGWLAIAAVFVADAATEEPLAVAEQPPTAGNDRLASRRPGP